MGLFEEFLPKATVQETPTQLETETVETPPAADPNNVGLFGDLLGKKTYQPNLTDKFFLKLDKKVLATEQGFNQAGMNLVSGLAGTGQFVGELGEEWGNILKSKKLKQWSKDLTEVSKVHSQAVDIYQQEHPEEAMQISPDAGFWQTTKEVVTNPDNMIKGLVQAVPMMLEAYLGHIAGGTIAKGVAAGPRTIATAQKFGRIAGIASGLFGDTYREARKKNVSPEASTAQAFLTSMGEAVIEEWTLGKKIGLFKSGKAAILKKNIGKLASTILIGGSKAYVRGAAEEATQQLNSNFWNFVFADRSQDLMKGVSQAAAIGGPLEMAMSGVFSGIGLGARRLNKIEQLERLDKFDDFIEQSDLNSEQKSETHQVIENKRLEIEQASISSTEEGITEEPAAEKAVPNANDKQAVDLWLGTKPPRPQITADMGKKRQFNTTLLQQMWDREFHPQPKMARTERMPEQTAEQRIEQDIRTVTKESGKEVDVRGEDIVSIVSDELQKAFGWPQTSKISEAQYFETGNGKKIRVAAHSVVYGEDVDHFIGIGNLPDADISISENATIEDIRKAARQAIQRWGTKSDKVHLAAEKAEQTRQIPDETITPEMLPEVHPDQELADAKAKVSVENTIDKLVNLIETYKEPLEELATERKQELAKRLHKVEEIYTSGKEPELLYQALKPLEGELPTLKYRNLTTEFTTDEIQEMIWAIRSTPKFTKVMQRIDTERGLLALLNGQSVRPFEIRNLQEVFGEKLVKALRKRGDIKLAWHQKIADVINLPIATLTSIDLSGVLRQGFLLGLTAPGAWAKHVKTAYSIFFNKDFKKIAEKVDFAIKTNQYYDFVKDEMGVEFTEWRTIAAEGLENREERYPSELAQKIPGVPRSGAAYTLGLNKMRLDAAIFFLNEWKGINTKTKEDYQMLGKFINLSTGRGDIKALKSILPMLNGAFFAPKLFASRFQLPIHLLRTMIKSPPVFKIMARQLLGLISVGGLVLGLASLIPGLTVDKDWESSDFLKMKYENSRFSFFQGYEQLVRTVVQLCTGHRKSTVTGRRMATERKDILWRFLQAKLSPVAGTTGELLSGKKFDGNPVEYTVSGIGKAALEKTVPLFIQDVYDAWQFGGFDSALLVAPVAFHGLSVQTYPVRPEQQAVLIKQQKAREYFGKDWDAIGSLAQELLRETEPVIEESEVVARQQRDGYPYLDEIIKEQKLSEKKVYRKLPENVQNELDSTFTEIGGLSRRIGNNWFLNDAKYPEYVNNVSEYLNKVLPLIVNSNKYKLLTNEQKKLILDRAIKEIKSAERKRLINEAKREDVQTLRERLGR